MTCSHFNFHMILPALNAHRRMPPWSMSAARPIFATAIATVSTATSGVRTASVVVHFGREEWVDFRLGVGHARKALLFKVAKANEEDLRRVEDLTLFRASSGDIHSSSIEDLQNLTEGLKKDISHYIPKLR